MTTTPSKTDAWRRVLARAVRDAAAVNLAHDVLWLADHDGTDEP